MNPQAESLLTSATKDTRTRGEILKIITNNSPCHLADIIYRLELLGLPNSNRWVRKHVEMLVKEGHAIESSEDGYSIITSREQLQRAKARFRANGVSAFNRYSLLEKNYRAAHPQEYESTQLELTLNEFYKD